MKKTINITIEESDYNWLKSNQTNISAWIRALIVTKRNDFSVNDNAELDKKVKDVFDGI